MVTHSSATLIDHIWTNTMNNYLTSSIWFYTISDHFPSFTSFSVPSVNDNNSLITFIKIKQIDMLDDHEIQKTHPVYPNCSLRKKKSYTSLYFSIKAKS